MSAILRVVTPPSVLPITLAEAKSHLRVSHSAEDGWIGDALKAACEDAGAESSCGFGVADYAALFDEFPANGEPLRLPARPVWSVASLEYRAADGDLVELDTAEDVWIGGWSGQLSPAAGEWPATQTRRPEAVEVRFQGGYNAETLPAVGRQAVLLILGDRFVHRGDGEATRPIPAEAVRLLRRLHHGGFV